MQIMKRLLNLPTPVQIALAVAVLLLSVFVIVPLVGALMKFFLGVIVGLLAAPVLAKRRAAKKTPPTI